MNEATEAPQVRVRQSSYSTRQSQRRLVRVFTLSVLIAAVLGVMGVAAALSTPAPARADALCDQMRAQYGSNWPCISVPTNTFNPTTNTPPAPAGGGNGSGTGGPQVGSNIGPGPGEGNGTPIVPVPTQQAAATPTTPATAAGPNTQQAPAVTPTAPPAFTPPPVQRNSVDAPTALPNAQGNGDSPVNIHNPSPDEWKQSIQQLGFCLIGHHADGGCVGGSLVKNPIVHNALIGIGAALAIAVIAGVIVFLFPETAIADMAIAIGGLIFDGIEGLQIGSTAAAIAIRGIFDGFISWLTSHEPDPHESREDQLQDQIDDLRREFENAQSGHSSGHQPATSPPPQNQPGVRSPQVQTTPQTPTPQVQTAPQAPAPAPAPAPQVAPNAPSNGTANSSTSSGTGAGSGIEGQSSIGSTHSPATGPGTGTGPDPSKLV